MLHARRNFLFRLAIVIGCAFKPRLSLSMPKAIPGKGDVNNEEQAIPPLGIDYFLNETINYDMSFLWFKKAAVGSYRFLRDGKGFKVMLEAETKGFVGFVTSYRKHLYISHLDLLPGGKKVRSRLFERYVTVKMNKEKTITQLDYDKRLMSWVSYRNGIIKEEKSEPIPEGMEYEDILSAYVNFRMGVFGPIKRSRKFKIHSMPEKGPTIIEVHLTSQEEAIRNKNLFGNGFSSDMFYLKVKVPKQIFKSKTGEVYLWIDRRLIPVLGVVKDYIGFGDIRAFLKP